MFRRIFLTLAFLGVLASRAVAVPGLTMVPLGLEGGNYAWRVDITPDLILAGGDASMAVELGFRLTGSPLLSVTNVNPSDWSPPNPGNVIFGWESLTDLDPGPGMNLKPVGLQFNLGTSEVFAAFGSDIFSTPGPRPFLKFLASGPGNGGSSTSTIQWLGAYNLGNGRIAQTVVNGAQNFDIYSGFLTQVPEPMSAALLAIGAVAATCFSGRRKRS